MTDRATKANTGLSAFWRACRFLRPQAPTIVLSVVCALLVGGALAGGLGTMLPIIRVLFSGDSVENWVNLQVAQNRLGVNLDLRQEQLAISKVLTDAQKPLPAQKAGLQSGTFTARGTAETDALLQSLASPQNDRVEVRMERAEPAWVLLPPVPWYFQKLQAFAQLLPGRQNPVRAVAAVFGILALISTFGNVMRFFQEYLTDRVAILGANRVRGRLYDHLLHMPVGIIQRTGYSDFVSRLSQDTVVMQEGYKTLLGTTVQEPIRAAMALGVALVLDWRLTLIILAFAPVMAVVIKIFGRKMQRASRRALQSSAAMLGQIEATLQGLRVVKSASAEIWERRRYMGIMDRLIHHALKMARIDAFSTPALETITLIVGGTIVLCAAYLVMVAKPAMSSDTFLAIMVCLMMIGESTRKCSKVNNVLHKANAAAVRVFEVLDMPTERPRLAGATADRPRIKLLPIQHEVRFENISFAYPGAERQALTDVSLTVKKGMSVAVVGRNGSGKTTLLALLPRFYDQQGGRILIDGVDTRTVTLKSLRSQIGIVTQDSVIFPGTIADNIAYGIRNPSRHAIEDAARRAYAHDFILQKPQGYDTLLGEMGGQLSGGQRQRICIARAIFRQSPILILDEATSQVDAESEELIQQAIEQVMRGRTTFLIAHRWHTIRSADVVVVLEGGRIAGIGPHEELMRNCEVYQQLYERQIAAPV